MSNFKECLDLVLKSEGGYVNHPSDPGGRTNLGVTQRVWEEFVGHPVSEADMKALTPSKVSPMYEMKFWRPCYCEVLPIGLNFLVFSMGVNAGPGRAVKLLQSTIGCIPDGVIGPRTVDAIKSSSVSDLIAKYSNARTEYYQSLKTFPIFGKGWLSRVDKEKSEALSMIRNG